MPLITIITVCRNARATLADTLESVVSQTTFQDYEHIVIDGASTDGTLDIIRSHSPRLVFWSSEPDGGIADAMNKGIAAASGDYILFLHADDYLAARESLEMAASRMANGADIYAFDILFQTASGRQRKKPRGATWYMNFKTGFLHQGCLCRRDLFDRIGGFDTNYSIAMDYEFFLRAVQRGASVEYVPKALSVMRDTGISSRQDWPTLRKRFSEEREIHRQLCQSSGMAIVYRLYWSLYLPYRWGRSLLQSSASD